MISNVFFPDGKFFPFITNSYLRYIRNKMYRCIRERLCLPCINVLRAAVTLFFSPSYSVCACVHARAVFRTESSGSWRHPRLRRDGTHRRLPAPRAPALPRIPPSLQRQQRQRRQPPQHPQRPARRAGRASRRRRSPRHAPRARTPRPPRRVQAPLPRQTGRTVIIPTRRGAAASIAQPGAITVRERRFSWSQRLSYRCAGAKEIADLPISRSPIN